MRNKDNDKEGIELDLTDIGYLLRELKRYEESIEVFRQQVELSEKIPNSKKLRNGYRWIGRILIDQNKREEAIKYYLKAVNHDHQIGNYEDESDDLADVAYTYYELNNIPESCNYYEKYIETREKYGYKDYKKYI
jgi:tetratricopeptide (TPR) repeat protein